MTEFPADITQNKLARINDVVDVDRFNVRAARHEVLATGLIKSIHAADGLSVGVASVNGQRGYRVRATSRPRLLIELRLAGCSTSQEVGGDRSTMMHPGQLLFTGLSDTSTWDIQAEPQSSFEVVEFRYEREFLTRLEACAPDIAGWAMDCLMSDIQWQIGQSVEMAAMAHQVISCAREPDAKTNLLLHAFALRLLTMVWEERRAPKPARGNGNGHGRTNGGHGRTNGGHGKTNGAFEQEILAFATDTIRKNPHASLTVGKIAHACRMSETAIKSLFKENMGTSIGSYIRTTRMEMAAELLNYGVSITAASQSLGYSSPEAFSKAVRNHFGRSPRDLSH